jgi:hypothetical protein
MKRLRHTVLAAAAFTVLLSIASAAEAQVAGNATLEEAAAPGPNYDKAEFRLWYPSGSGPLQAIVVLVPGSNGVRRLPVPNYPTAWLPTARVARAWQALVNETPFEPSARAASPTLQRTER